MADISKKRLSKKKNMANIDVVRRKAVANAIKNAAKSDSSPFRYQATYDKNGVETTHTVDMSKAGKHYPTLISEVVDWMRKGQSSITLDGVKTKRSQINLVLKFLNSWHEINGDAVCPKSIHNFNEEVGASFLLWYRGEDGNDTTKAIKYRAVRQILTSTAQHHGHDLLMPPCPWREKVIDHDTYSDADVRQWLRLSLTEIREFKQAVKAANNMADLGDFTAKTWSPEMVAATVRDHLGLRLMRAVELRKHDFRSLLAYVSEYEAPSKGTGMTGWYTSFLPGANTIAAAITVVSCRTGWNLQSILDLNINDWSRPYALSDTKSKPLYLVYTRKKRGGGVQETISTGAETHVYGVLKWVFHATEPLRNQMRGRISQLEEKAGREGLTRAEAESLNKLKSEIDSFWLHVDSGDTSRLASLKPDGLKRATAALYTKHVDANASTPFSASMARDAWILWAYESSGFNLLVAQMAAGHSSLKSIINYINKKKVTAANRQKIWDFQDHLFAEIEAGRVDPHILRGRVEDGAMSPKQARALADKEFTKTPHGAYCTDPYNPDPDVDRDHKPGEVCGTYNCHRCRNAFWFLDSIQDIADEVQALRHRKTETAIDAWELSQLPEKLQFYEGLLMKFEESDRREAMSRMRKPLPSVQFQASKHFYEGA